MIAGQGQDTALMGGGTRRTRWALETTCLAVCSAVQRQDPSGLWMCGNAHREGVLGRVNKVDERVLGRMGTRDLQSMGVYAKRF